ncbi:phosphate ABC transporter permease subunit PstC [Anaerococcus sp. AGMB09787]|uniref:phosphate ABC transporter permease subunit PstC n=1 Tax=Anaerococcus sp. AGMB09787 TaxID=2922869 RepID=UPI001FAFFD9A|nr:phosphate ABC transporter permease subunit PstC [Anaerococcus sp. AGMB09787]
MEKDIKGRIFEIIFLIATLLSISFIALICIFIFKAGISFVSKYGLWEFISGSKWKPTAVPPSYGILPMIVGSIVVTLLSLVFSVPFALAISVFMAFYAKKTYKPLSSLIKLMAAVPSVVYGFFALMVIVPIIASITNRGGMNILTAAILLAIMITPTIVEISETALRNVPQFYYNGSIALGATKEETIFKIMIPAAKNAIFSSIILAMGRSIGETMAVYLVIGNQPRMPGSIFEGVRTMTTNIVLEMGYASGDHRQALIATGMVLFVFILIINLIFNIVRIRNEKQ